MNGWMDIHGQTFGFWILNYANTFAESDESAKLQIRNNSEVSETDVHKVSFKLKTWKFVQMGSLSCSYSCLLSML